MRRYLFLIVLIFTVTAIAIPSFASSSQIILGVEGYENYYDDDGSCPYLYTFDGSGYVMENDIISVARFPANEYTDYLLLNNAINPVQGKIKLQLKEIPGETSKVDFLSLVSINHPAGTKAGVDDKGQAHTYSNPTAPLVATYKDSPVFTKIYTEDKQGVSLYDQETLTLEFPAMDLSQGAKLVLKVDGFERSADLPETLVVKVPAISLQTEENGQWVTRSKFYPKEYAAYGVFDLKPYLTQSNIKVRLLSESCKQNVAHLIDYVALDNTADQCTQTPLSLVSALKNGTLDVVSLVYSADSSYLDLASATDYVDLEYTAPSQDGVNDYFFVSKGYYQPVHNTFYVATKDGTSQWVDRYSSSTDWFSSSEIDIAKEIDLTAFQSGADFPSSGGTYQVRVSNIVGAYTNRWAFLDRAYLKVDGQVYALISAVDTSTGQNALTQLQSSDEIKWDTLNKGVILTFATPIPVTQVTLNKTATTLSQGSQESLISTVLPSDARPSSLTWTSSNNSIATVSQNGVVTGVAVGTARITATSSYGPSAFCDVTVRDVTSPVVSSLLPAANATVTEFQPLISAKLTDKNGIDSGRVSMTLNGLKVGSFNAATGVISYKPEYVLAQGLYTVAVNCYDPYNNQGSATWSFTVKDAGPPQISNVLPPDKMGTKTTRPTISASIVDAGGIDVDRLSLTVDGTPLSILFQPDRAGSIVSGTVYGMPATDLSNSMHTALLSAFDTTGNNQQKTWQFGINTFSDMLGNTTNCTDCHNEGAAAINQRHAVNAGNCDQCHTIVYNHGEFPCSDCHTGHSTGWPPAVSSYACTTCHNSSYPNVPSHNQVPHSYTALGQECQTCHSASLTTEHNIYVEGRGYGYDCYTCHASTSSAVKDAIATANTSCVACHSGKTDHLELHNTTLDNNCKTCHAANLSTDHITNRPDLGFTCDTCHASLPGTDVIGAVDTSCSRCHDTAHNLAITSQAPTEIPLYSGLTWSEAIDARIYGGESWLPSDYLPGGKLYISRRSNTLSGKTIRDFYNQTLVANGWTLTSPLPDDQSNFFDISFTKNNQKARISFYGGEDHTATPLVTEGYRVEILLN